MTKEETLAKLVHELKDIQAKQADIVSRMTKVMQGVKKAGDVKSASVLKKKLLGL